MEMQMQKQREHNVCKIYLNDYKWNKSTCKTIALWGHIVNGGEIA